MTPIGPSKPSLSTSADRSRDSSHAVGEPVARRLAVAARVDEHGAIARLRQVLGPMAQALLVSADAVEREDGGARRQLGLDDLDGERGARRADLDEACTSLGGVGGGGDGVVVIGRVDDRVRADALGPDLGEQRHDADDGERAESAAASCARHAQAHGHVGRARCRAPSIAEKGLMPKSRTGRGAPRRASRGRRRRRRRRAAAWRRGARACLRRARARRRGLTRVERNATVGKRRASSTSSAAFCSILRASSAETSPLARSEAASTRPTMPAPSVAGDVDGEAGRRAGTGRGRPRTAGPRGTCRRGLGGRRVENARVRRYHIGR